MMFAQTAKFKVLNVLITLLLLGSAGTCLCQARQYNNQASGEIKLEGEYVERLVLRLQNGRTVRLDRPDETIRLPVGEYSLTEIHLCNGYSCRPPSRNRRIKVTEDKSSVLKLGAPLTQNVKIQRQGDVLVLNYELLGQGGRNYTSNDRSKPPVFTVYKGDKKIFSDKFEFG
jgi:hypothetical protein